MSKKKLGKKSQVWISDYTIGLLLFTLSAIIAAKIVINSFSANTAFIELKSDASKISELLLTEGYPADWNEGNSTDIIRAGLLSEKRLDPDKVSKLMNRSYINYTSLKPRLQTKYDFLVTFENTGSGLIEFNGLCAIANDSVINDHISMNASNISDCLSPIFDFKFNNMVKLNRLVVYNSAVKRMVVYVWE